MKSRTENQLLTYFKEIETFNLLLKEIEKLDKEGDKLKISPFAGSSESIFLSFLSSRENFIVALFPDIKRVDEIKVELTILGLDDYLLVVNEFDNEAIQRYLTKLSKVKKCIVISTYKLLRMKLPSKENIDNKITRLDSGGDLEYDDLIEYLNLIDYDRDKYVDMPGSFAVRGSIIDVWSHSEKSPVRLEYDGDFLESIRTFDPESQRSTGIIESTTIASKISSDKDYDSNIFDYFSAPVILASGSLLREMFKSSKIDTAPPSAESDLDEDLRDELFNGSQQSTASECIEDEELLSANGINELFAENARWALEEELGDDRFILDLYDAPVINSNFELLFNSLKNYVKKGFEIVITAENEIQGKRLADLLSEYNKELESFLEQRKIKIFIMPVKEGFIHKTGKILFLTNYQIFNKPYRSKLPYKKYKKSRGKSFASIKKGDFVVHENFGIGRYEGLETIKIGMVNQESIKIAYAEGAVVYVNLNYLSLVKKFSSKENIAPRLTVLGGGEWKKTKKKVKSKIKEAARELLVLYAKRKSTPGFSFSLDSIWQKELEASFIYEDTPDQTSVTEAVKNDMESENPMDRLVCGDVGFGKTEIAVRSAFKAVSDGKQVGLLVPTTILAEQHYNTFRDRLTQFPVRVEALSRFQKKKKQVEIVKDLEEGKVDVVIGTHRLLSKDIKFKDLGLLIIDEEHRFGVMAKEKLRSLKNAVDTLTLTATPIPRTLNLSLLGARDLSIIATPPANRQPIYTRVEIFDIAKIREWILDEIKRNGQIYFVHDRVNSIDKIAGYIKKHIPEISVGVAHGQMKPAQLENQIHDFLNRKFHMLISTKIIESGIDIPNVNTIIINRADRFGLAELHQLRGRVGRSDRQAFAYLLVPSLDTITKKAVKRLQAIEEYTDLGEGFNLSMRDLEIRGAGNLLGTEQSGVIDAVGFDLYVKLLDEAVNELKESEFQTEFKELPKQLNRSEPTIDTYFEINIPASFIPDQADRLSCYTSLFAVVKLSEIKEAKEDLVDRFGKLPANIERLIQIAALRFHASFSQFERIIIRRDKMIIILPKEDNKEFYKEKFVHLMKFVGDKYSNKIRFTQGKDVMRLEMRNDFRFPEDSTKFLINLCKEINSEVLGVNNLE